MVLSRLNITDLNIKDEGEFSNGFNSVYLFNVGLGFLYHDETMQIGISIPTILSVQNEDIRRVRHFYGNASFLIGDEYATLKWKPSILLKYEKAVPFQTTLGTQVWISEVFAPGIHWRVGESIALSIELIIDQSFVVTGAYDFTSKELNNYSNGSFELMFSYRFGGQDFRNN